jgi:hypothetical protein
VSHIAYQAVRNVYTVRTEVAAEDRGEARPLRQSGAATTPFQMINDDHKREVGAIARRLFYG